MPSRAERQAQAAQRRARVVNMRRAGATFDQIGRELGITDGRAHQLYKDALARTVRVPTQEHIDLEVDRLDQLQAIAIGVLRARHLVVQGGQIVRGEDGQPMVDHAPTLNAIRTLLAVQQRRAALLGLDAPTRVDANVTLRVAWERATEQERDAVLNAEVASLEAELARLGPADPPSVETITTPPVETITTPPDPEAIAFAVEAALDAAHVPPDQREAAYQAVEQQLQERDG